MYVGTWAASRGYVAAAAAQLGAPVDRPVPELRDRGRLDRRRLPEGEVLDAALRRDRATGARARSSRPSPTATGAATSCSPILEEVFRARHERGVAGGARPRRASRARRSTTCAGSARARRGSSSTSIRGSGTRAAGRVAAAAVRAGAAGAAGAGARRAHGAGAGRAVRLRAGAGAGPGRVAGCSESSERRCEMPRQALQPEGLAVPKPPYSPVVVSGDTVYTAGQIGNDPDGNLVEGGIAEQTRQDARERPDVPRRGGLHAGRRRQGERVPRRPRRLPGLQRGLRRVLHAALPGADVGAGGAAARRADRDRGGGAAVVTERDLVGYGASPPDPQWPGGARLALSFVLNYEEGGERSVLEGDAESESFLHEVVGAAADRRPAQPEHRVDVRVRKPGRLLARAPHLHGARPAADRLRGRPGARAEPGCGAGDGRRRLGGGEPRLALVRLRGMLRGRGARAHAPRDRGDRAGVRRPRRSAGTRGAISENTRRLVVEEGGFLYDSDDYADELPYWVEVGGPATTS